MELAREGKVLEPAEALVPAVAVESCSRKSP